MKIDKFKYEILQEKDFTGLKSYHISITNSEGKIEYIPNSEYQDFEQKKDALKFIEDFLE